AWPMFARYHYLTGTLGRGARCFIGLWRGAAVAFCATIALIGRRKRWRISRLVTLPDYQGAGIGTRMARAVAELHGAEGHRVNITSGHPALIGHCRRSPFWRAVNVKKTGSPRDARRFARSYRGSPGRSVVSFEFLGKGYGDTERNSSGEST
ncbi:MAG: GNAT family N-acetyltransferase, partial [Planctomycetota bacterium]|nr:GNAT family N-acetyltransferase [Planctomycetota bacterium]